jgi:MFS family permease
VSSTKARQAAFRDVFAIREFRAVWASQILSEAGDRLALVALTILVYDRTRSPLLSAVAYAAGYVPWVIGGLVFAGLGDRLPRRQVMVACDLIRAALVAVMLVPGMPVAVMVGMLYATTMAQAPFEAARSAILPDIVRGERYALVAGAAAGGIMVALIGARTALGVDVATFAASAILVGFGTRARPAAAGPGPRGLRQLSEGARLVLGDRAIRTLMMLGWLIALYSIPEGIAAPYAARLGGGPMAAGLIIASGQAGAILAAPLFTRKIRPLTRLRLMGPMACCACAVLPLTAFRPGLAVSMGIFALSGTFAIYQIAANTAFVDWVPPERRAQAFGVASSGTVACQGAALMAAGVAAQVASPAMVIAVAGGLGAVTACCLALRWRRIPRFHERQSPAPIGTVTVAARPAGEETRKVTHPGPLTITPPVKPVNRGPHTGSRTALRAAATSGCPESVLNSPPMRADEPYTSLALAGRVMETVANGAADADTARNAL